MTVKIVTDSMCDIPQPIVKELGITVIPAYVRFGDEIYRDGIDLSPSEFYRKLQSGSVFPTSFQPPPKDFLRAYQDLLKTADGILSIQVSSKLSGAYESALATSRQISPDGSLIRVIDSESVTMGQGMLVIEAAKMAGDGMGLSEISEKIKSMVSEVHTLGFFDTLKYLAMGGRIGRARGLLGSVLEVKPLLSLSNGEIIPVGHLRSRARATDKLYEFVKSAGNVKNLSIIHSTTPDEAAALAERLDGVFPKEKTIISQLGAVVGVHGGPGILFVAVLGDY